MYICSTKKGNVIYNINLMKKHGNGMLIQFRVKEHDKLGKLFNDGKPKPVAQAIMDKINKTTLRKVNIKTRVIHTTKCKHAGKNVVAAYLVGIHSSKDLSVCGHCH